MRDHIQNPKIHAAYQTLQELSSDAKTRELAFERHLQRLNENTELLGAEERGLQRGREEGREEGREAMLQELHREGVLTKAELEARLQALRQGAS